MLDDDIVEAARRLLDICKRKNLTVATAESCTAGLVAGTLTEIPGVSSILDRGFITYSNQAKQDMLGVSAETLRLHGAVIARDRRANGAWCDRACAGRSGSLGDRDRRTRWRHRR